MKELLDIVLCVAERVEHAEAAGWWCGFAADDLVECRRALRAGDYYEALHRWRSAQVQISGVVWSVLGAEREEFVALISQYAPDRFGGDHPAYRRPLTGPGDTE